MPFGYLLILATVASGALGLLGNGMSNLQLEKCQTALKNINGMPGSEAMQIRFSDTLCNGPISAVPPSITALGLGDCYAALKESTQKVSPERTSSCGKTTTQQESTPSKFAVALYSILSASLVGLSGIFPLIILPNINGNARSAEQREKILKRLLSFSVGGLLGDVFLHLLPESWNDLQKDIHENGAHQHDHLPAVFNGMWVLIGLLSFLTLEKVFQSLKDDSPGDAGDNSNIFSGYLNLIANFIDNFTHGLAIAGSFLVSRWVGLLTTLAILIHELPHEIGDFAILLRAGFNRWTAAKLQMLTATGGLLGSAFVLAVDSTAEAGAKVSWILPFTSGGFIYIALCSVVPDLLKEESPKESVIQLAYVVSAMAVMGVVSIF